MAIADYTGYLVAAKSALDIFKGIRSELPSGSGAAKINQQIEKAEAALVTSEAELAKSLGYTLCQCTFPPQIMLWREAENAHICPRSECGRRIEAPFKIAKRGPPASGVKCPYCNADTTLLKEEDHEHFAFAGWRNHTLKCVNCEKQIERQWKPDGGYEI